MCFVVAVFVHLCKLQNVETREVNTRGRKGCSKLSNVGRWKKEETNFKSQKYFHMFFGGCLFFRLFLPADYIFSFTPSVRSAAIRPF